MSPGMNVRFLVTQERRGGRGGGRVEFLADLSFSTHGFLQNCPGNCHYQDRPAATLALYAAVAFAANTASL